MALSESRVADLLEARCAEICQRFLARAREEGASYALPTPEVVDSLPVLLGELAAALRRDLTHDEDDLSPSAAASSHGLQRFCIGYDIGAMIREYVTLNQLIWSMLKEHEVEATLGELSIISDFFGRAIVDAAVHYSTARDAKLQQQAAQHAAFLAHELRNPLGSARMALALMIEHGTVTPSRALDSLERGLSRVSHLIDDTLVTVRLQELGAMDYAELDLRAFLEEITEDSSVEAEAKGVVLEVSGGGTMRADVRALRSAVSNLVRNAVKFTPQGRHIHVRARRTDDRVVLEVEDSCGGLPEETIQKLFDPYVQVGADRSGFGLGLAIAKQATTAHGGQVRVHNLPGKGCVFVLDIPVEPGP